MKSIPMQPDYRLKREPQISQIPQMTEAKEFGVI